MCVSFNLSEGALALLQQRGDKRVRAAVKMSSGNYRMSEHAGITRNEVNALEAEVKAIADKGLPAIAVTV